MIRTTAIAAAGVAAVAAFSASDAPRQAPALHTELEASIPAEDTVITSALDDVVLIFSGPVEAGLSRVQWVGPAGDTVALEVSAAPDRPHVLTVVAPPAANGAQRLLWRTVAADGHRVAGEIPFEAAIPGLEAPDAEPTDGEAGAAAPVPGDPPAPDGDADSAGRTDGPSAARIAIRGAGMFCLLGFAGLLWFGMGTTILDEPRSHRVASVLGLGATVLLTLDVLLWMSELQVPGIDLAGTFSAALETRTGAVEITRAALAGLGFLLFAGTRGVRLGAVVAMLAVVAGALSGHQATIRPLVSLPANGLHLGAAAVWAGGVLLLGTWPVRAESGGGAPVIGWTFRRVALRVSSAALLASGVILLTAVAQNLIYLPSPGALFTSGYGNLLIAKVTGFAALIGFGAYHRLRLIPALETLETDAAGSRLARAVRLELIVVVVVVFVAAALAQTPPPVE